MSDIRLFRLADGQAREVAGSAAHLEKAKPYIE